MTLASLSLWGKLHYLLGDKRGKRKQQQVPSIAEKKKEPLAGTRRWEGKRAGKPRRRESLQAASSLVKKSPTTFATRRRAGERESAVEGRECLAAAP